MRVIRASADSEFLCDVCVCVVCVRACMCFCVCLIRASSDSEF